MTPPAAGDGRPLVLHLVYRFDIGGLENGVVNLINHMPASAYRHAVIALTEVRRISAGASSATTSSSSRCTSRPATASRLYPRLLRLFRELRPAIVHTRNLAALECQVPPAGRRAGAHPRRAWPRHRRPGRHAPALPVAAPRVPAVRARTTSRCRATSRGYLEHARRCAARGASRRSTTASIPSASARRRRPRPRSPAARSPTRPCGSSAPSAACRR